VFTEILEDEAPMMNLIVGWKMGSLRNVYLDGMILMLGLWLPNHAGTCYAQDPDEVRLELNRAVEFFRTKVSVAGGYVYQYSSDLKKREGEGAVGPHTVWIEAPGTPFVGQAFLTAFQYCHEPQLMLAAKETADALIQGQLQSGGWDNRIEFAAQDRRVYRYRCASTGAEDGTEQVKQKNITTLDDNKSQLACRFLMNLDKQLNFSDRRVHEAALYALDCFTSAQYSNGAWPQRYQDFNHQSKSVVVNATIPVAWSREYPGAKYANFYTLNDNTISDMILLMLDAWEIYADRRYLESAKRGGDFLLLAQLPEPQPGWAQQYNEQMHPAWARKFEPPAITGGESQGVMKTLMTLYRRLAGQDTDARKYLTCIPKALNYYRKSLLPDGRLARFYELGSNRPLYMNQQYKLTYENNDLPDHYAFVVSSKLERLTREYDEISVLPIDELWETPRVRPPGRSSAKNREVTKILAEIDSRGAWVEAGKLRYHGKQDSTREVIKTSTFCSNILALSGWLGNEDSHESVAD